MLKKYSCCIILLSTFTVSCFGQYNSFQTDINFQNRPQGFIASLSPAPPEKIGSIYLYEEFNKGEVYLKDSTKLADLNIKFDLKQNVLDVQYNQDIKVLPVYKVLGFSIKKSNGESELYVNGATLFGTTSPHRDHLFELLNKDLVTLCSKTIATIIEASSNPAMGLSKEAEVVTKKRYYIIYKDSSIEVGSKSQLKDDLIEMFGDEVGPQLKKVNPKQEEDLTALVKKLNDLKKQS